MPRPLAAKILADHLLDGDLVAGGEIGIRIDQTLTQDATGTTAFLLLEAMDVDHVKTELSVSYVDHNMAQFGPENHNDHLYLQSVAAKVGAHFSRPGNGICHQVHLERFARPGKTLIGSDSHTPTGGGMGMLAMGAGGLDVAVAMAGGAFYLTCPNVIGVELRGKLQPWVAAKDIVLKLLSILTTRGNVGCVIEYFGEGVATLPVPARATCTNMGAELGVTCSVFPADEVTEQFLSAQGRGDQFTPMAADDGCRYDTVTKRLHSQRDAAVIEQIRAHCPDAAVDKPDDEGFVDVSFSRIVIDLSELTPLAAGSPSPDNIVSLVELSGKEVHQVLIGSCTNSSYQDLMLVAEVLAGRTVHPDVELGIAPGSRQVLNMLADNGALAKLVGAGARILESSCGPCIGQGFSPAENTVSVRTFNRNFAGRTGTRGDEVYLVSAESAVAAAVAGALVDPRTLSDAVGIACPVITPPAQFAVDDGMIQHPLPAAEAAEVHVVRGSTIVKPPAGDVLADPLIGTVAIKVGDRITTDHITPAGTLLKYRSNVPEYAKYVFNCFNEPEWPNFADRCLGLKDSGRAGFIVAGDSYGQGSSREHAALCPMYLGVRAVLARTIERIHQANLVNFGILPLTFASAGDYAAIDEGDELVIDSVADAIDSGERVVVRNVTKGAELTCCVSLAPRQRRILAAGGLLRYVREGQ
ncbi:MAG: aconitate hydratase [Planctomycetota bacterium]|jgi:aconitate hydratase